VASSCGRGIKVCGEKYKITKKEGILACKYIANPHLINGLKYDLRVYVLVTSYNPLKIYIYNDGLVRFATQKYNNNPESLQNKFMHLTNFSINKRAPNFVKNTDKNV
jgi:tubulin polyglutamylase TTLL4